MNVNIQELIVCLAIIAAVVCRALYLFALTPYPIVDMLISFQIITSFWLIMNICIECMKEKKK